MTENTQLFEDGDSIVDNGGVVNPYSDAVAETYRSGKSKSFVVANSDAAEHARQQIRAAANSQGIGAKTVTVTLPDGKVRVHFQGREKRSRKNGPVVTTQTEAAKPAQKK